MKRIALIACVLLAGCDPTANPRVRVIDTYLEVPPRDGDDWRTLVEYPDSTRVVLRGKLGVAGEEIAMPDCMRAAP